MGHNHDFHGQVAGIGSQHLAPDRIDALVNDYLLPVPGLAHAHGAGLEQGRSAVIEGSVGAVHVQKACHGSLELKDGLQSSLGAFSLVGRIGCHKGRLACQGIHCGRNAVVIVSGAQEGQVLGILGGQAFALVADFLLCHPFLGQKGLRTQVRGYVGKEVVQRADADGLKHVITLFVCMRDIGHDPLR